VAFLPLPVVLALSLIIPVLTQAPLSLVDAAPVPTPTAGTPALLAPPVPNPVPYPGAPNQQLLSLQYNTNFYALWNYATLLANALNSCTYLPGAALASVTYTYPVTASVGACSPGTGAALTLGLAHGDYEDLTSSQTITGARTFTAPVSVAGLTSTTGTFSGPVSTGALTSTSGAFSGPVSATTGTFSNGLTTNGLSSTAIYNYIGTSAGNAVLQVPGTGAMFVNYTSGGSIYLGPNTIVTQGGGVSATSLTDTGGLTAGSGSLNSLTTAGLTSTAIYNTFGTSAGNAVLQVPGTGNMFLNYSSGGSVYLGPNLNVTQGGALSGASTGAFSLGVTALGGFYGQGGLPIPYDSEGNSVTTDHIERGATVSGISLAGTTVAFARAYTVNPVCVATWNATTPPSGALGVAVTTTALKIYGPTSGYGATFLCVGY
jgi:hypothetical protein